MNTVIQLFKSILEISLFASVMIIVVLLIRMIAKDRINIKMISFLWLLVILRLCIPGMLESPVHIGGLFPTEKATIEQSDLSDFSPAYEDDISINNTSNLMLSDNEHAPLQNDGVLNDLAVSESKNISFWGDAADFIQSLDLWVAASIIWITGSTIILLFTIKESVVFGLHIKKNSEFVKDQAILDIINVYKRANKIHRAIRISSCTSVQMPMVIGVLNPRILLSAHMIDELERKYLEPILLHELCHIKRNDVLKSYLYIIAKALHWFNPLVWMGIMKMKEDMEFACDGRVLKLLDGKHRIEYCESLIQATRFLKAIRIPQFASSLYEKKSNLKERVVKMINPQRKSKKVAMISFVLAIVMVLACFTTACQPTPEELIVQNKADAELKEAIEQTVSPATEDFQNNESVDHITEKYTNDSNTVMVNIDADVATPKISQIPVASVEKITVPADQVEQIVKAFYGDTQLYDVVSTKEDIQETILRMQLMLTDDEALLHSSVADVSGSTDLDLLKSMVNEKIKKLQESLQDAPDNRPKINGYDAVLSQGGLYACVDIGEGQSGYLEANVSDSFGQNINLYAFGGDYSEFYRTLEYQLSTPIDIGFDNAEFQNAKKMAGKMIADMGIDGVTLGEAYLSADNCRGDEIFSDREFYVFCFERTVGEGAVDFNFVSTMNNTNQYDTETYDNVYPYETIQIWVEGDEFRQFTWKAPMNVKKIINDNVALAIDYKKAIDLMKQQVFVQFVNVDVERAALFSAYKVDINSIDIELVRIREIDTGSYLVIPAWVFHGEVNAAITQAYINAMKTESKEVGQYVSANTFWISGDNIMTINALDGSVIDIEAGY